MRGSGSRARSSAHTPRTTSLTRAERSERRGGGGDGRLPRPSGGVTNRFRRSAASSPVSLSFRGKYSVFWVALFPRQDVPGTVTLRPRMPFGGRAFITGDGHAAASGRLPHD